MRTHKQNHIGELYFKYTIVKLYTIFYPLLLSISFLFFYEKCSFFFVFFLFFGIFILAKDSPIVDVILKENDWHALPWQSTGKWFSFFVLCAVCVYPWLVKYARVNW